MARRRDEMRTCIECESLFIRQASERGNRLTCSKECSAKRVARLAEEKKEKRREARNQVKAQCIACGAEFSPRNSQQRYCGKTECQMEGLRRAIERQREKRKAKEIPCWK